jgi:hypothetical protein
VEVPYFAEMERLGKLKRVGESAIRSFTASECRPFRKGSVRDDRHLYEAAATTGALVVTRDVGLLRKAGDIERATGVCTVDADDT